MHKVTQLSEVSKSQLSLGHLLREMITKSHLDGETAPPAANPTCTVSLVKLIPPEEVNTRDRAFSSPDFKC